MPKILAIDDKQDNLVSIAALLQNLMPHCEVITAQSGQKGIDRALTESPDVILLDVQMPGMDGYETCRRLKNSASTRHIPVIMLTAIRTAPESRIKGLEIGADAFLAKPIDEGELVSQVRVALRIKRAEDALRSERDLLERAVRERTAALQESERRFRQIYEHVAVGIARVSLDLRIESVNEAYCSMLGYSEEELIGKHIKEVTAPERRCKDLLPQSQLARGEINHYRMEKRFIHRSGHVVHGLLDANLIRNAQSEPSYFIKCVVDITDQKLAEADLADSLNAMRELYGVSRAVLDCTDFEQAARRIFDGCCKAIGAASGYVALLDEAGQENQVLFLEAGGLPCDVDPSLPMPIRGFRTVAYAEEKTVYENDFMNSNWAHLMPVGQFALRNVLFAPLLLDGKAVGLLGLANKSSDFTEKDAQVAKTFGDMAAIALHRTRQQTSLRRSEEKYRSLVEAIPDGIGAVDSTGRVTVWSAAAEKMFGYQPEEMIGKYIGVICPKNLLEEQKIILNQVIEGGHFKGYETVRRKKDGSLVPVEISLSALTDESGKFLGATGVIRDISERKRAEESLRQSKEALNQAQKMESIGRLAGGVAHDYNNMLGVILGYTEMALDRVEKCPALRAHLEQIQKAARRSADLTRQLLAFARKQTIAPRLLDLNATVESMLKMLRRLIGEDIDLAWLPASDLGMVKMDPAQIDQILANLCVNARDAIAGVGRVTMETDNATFDEAYCSSHGGFAAGDYVLLTVSDDGCGMDMETLEHIFEPFFTTKEVGRGTGLGLATVYGIVRQNSGFIRVYSEPGKGSAFKIYLPRHDGESDAIKAESDVDIPRSRGETVLLVEDETAMLNMGQMMLERLGYRVLTASTPDEAMRLAEERAGAIDLLITDVIMPQMNGRELANLLQPLYPGLKVLFMSGYTADAIAHRGELEEDVHYMQKPFTMKELAGKVRQALAGEAGHER